LTGLDVGHAVIIKREVAVAVNVCVEVVVGKAVIWNSGVLVAVAVLDAVMVDVAVRVNVVVGVEVGGAAVGETEATSLPTVKSTPQTCGRVSVAE
jgi:hypothetical protein